VDGDGEDGEAEREGAHDCTSRFIWVKRRERVARESVFRALGKYSIAWPAAILSGISDEPVDPSIDHEPWGEGGREESGRVRPMRDADLGAACILREGGREGGREGEREGEREGGREGRRDRARWKNRRTRSFFRMSGGEGGGGRSRSVVLCDSQSAGASRAHRSPAVLLIVSRDSPAFALLLLSLLLSLRLYLETKLSLF